MATSKEDKVDVPDNDGTEETEKPKKSLLESTTSNTSTSEWLRDYFAVALGLKIQVSILDEVSFEGIARYILSDQCKKVVTLAGAGISTSAGIPDFRSPGSGVYDRLKKLDIPDPQKVFDLEYFKEHPDIVYSLRKELMVGTYKPTPCHYFVKLLEKKGKLLRHFTQNIDGLDLDAGIDPDLVVQAHGTCKTYSCMECKHPYSKEFMADILKDDDLKVPKCNQKDCTGVIRPDIVFFGENLTQRFAETVSDIEECDMMIILGTSLVVQPFASLTSRCKSDVPRLYINMEKTYRTGVHPISALMFGGGFEFGEEKNIRDIFWQGKCDNGCFALASLLGWGDELVSLVHEEHAKIDKTLGKPPQPPWKPSTEKSEDTGDKSPGNAKSGNVTKGKTNPGSTKTAAKPKETPKSNQVPKRTVAPSTKPVVSSTKPVVPFTKPPASSTKPVSPSTKPVAPSTKPPASSTKPVAPSTKPPASSTKPVSPSTKPVVASTKPSAPSTKTGTTLKTDSKSNCVIRPKSQTKAVPKK